MSTKAVFWGRSRNDLLKLVVTVLLPLMIMLIPTNDTFTFQLKLFLAITLVAIIAFATGSIPQTAVAVALPVVYVLTGLAPGEVAFAAWTTSTPWMMFGALALTMAMEKTKLLNRIAYKCVLLTGASYKGIIIGMILAGLIMNLIILDNAMIPMAALAYGVCRALDLKPGKASAGIMLAAAFSALSPSNYLYSTGIVMTVGIGRAAGGPDSLGWLDIIIHQLPMVLYTVLLGVLCIVLFKPEKPINGKEYFQNALNKMGKISLAEKKAIVIAVILFVLLFASNYIGIDPGWIFTIVPCLFFLPGVDVLNEEDAGKMNWGIIFFVAGCIAIGNTSSALGVGEIITSVALPLLEGRSYYVFFLFVWLLFFLCNFLLTPMAMVAAFTFPLTQVAVSLGIDPTTVYFIETAGLDQIVFPYEYALYLFIFAFGMIKMNDFVKAMLCKIVINFVLVFALLIPYWNMMDMIYL